MRQVQSNSFSQYNDPNIIGKIHSTQYNKHSYNILSRKLIFCKWRHKETETDLQLH